MVAGNKTVNIFYVYKSNLLDMSPGNHFQADKLI